MRNDMSDTLIVAISQSGTTTDTNRTVDLARARGASVLAIVNRRNSDLTDKADGVLYTSDGRDVEMAVPSTKAFYAQVAAGCLLAVAIADAVGARRPVARRPVRAARRPAGAARRHDRGAGAGGRRSPRSPTELAPSRRYWAIVGNGPNRIAAQELRIKLSELCYKSIAFDVTEDKKHIDLSAEPLILVCAAGLTGSNADDVAKEVAIYRAHKAAPVVIGTEGEGRFGAALHLIGVPADPPAAGVRALGHGRAPLRLRGGPGHRRTRPCRCGRPGRRSRASCPRRIQVLPGGDVLLRSLRPQLTRPAALFFDGLRAGELRRPPGGVDRAPGWRRCCATPSAPPRSTPTRPSTARSARPASSSTT